MAKTIYKLYRIFAYIFIHNCPRRTEDASNNKCILIHFQYVSAKYVKKAVHLDLTCTKSYNDSFIPPQIMCEVVCRRFEASFLSHIETFYSSGVIFTIHWHRLVVIRVLLRCCDSDFAAADLPDACSCSRWINHSLSLSLSLCSRREMGSIKRCHGDGAGSWLYLHRLYVGSSELVLRGAVSPDRWAPDQHQSLTITPTLKWCKTVGIGDPLPPPAVCSRSADSVWVKVSRWSHGTAADTDIFFFSAEDNRMRKVPTVQTKVGADAHAGVQLESRHLMEHSSLSLTSHGSNSFFFFQRHTG